MICSIVKHSCAKFYFENIIMPTGIKGTIRRTYNYNIKGIE